MGINNKHKLEWITAPNYKKMEFGEAIELMRRYILEQRNAMMRETDTRLEILTELKTLGA